MTRLTSIIDAAVGDTVSTANLLRMVKVVASRLDTPPLEDWVNCELNGYTDETQLPAYRGPFPAQVMGHFVGPYNSKAIIALPSLNFPRALRNGWCFKVGFLQPISELEALSRADQNLQNPWPADTVAMVNGLIEKGEIDLLPFHGLLTAYRPISPQQMQAILDVVRTRVLGLALDLEKVAPRAGESDATPIDRSVITTVVNNNIYGDRNNMAMNSPGAVQNSSVVEQGDLQSLLTAAREAGLAPSDADALKSAVLKDEGEGHLAAPGPNTRDYMGRLALGTGSVAGKVGIGAAGATVSALLRAYFGIA